MAWRLTNVATRGLMSPVLIRPGFSIIDPRWSTFRGLSKRRTAPQLEAKPSSKFGNPRKSGRGGNNDDLLFDIPNPKTMKSDLRGVLSSKDLQGLFKAPKGHKGPKGPKGPKIKSKPAIPWPTVRPSLSNFQHRPPSSGRDNFEDIKGPDPNLPDVELPLPRDYPSLPHSAKRDPLKLLHLMFGHERISEKFKPDDKNGKLFKCSMTLTVSDNDEIAVESPAGRRVKVGHWAAQTMLSQVWKRGMLDLLYGPGADARKWFKSRDGQGHLSKSFDVYNYAARHNGMLKVKVEKESLPFIKHKESFAVTLELPELDMSATAKNLNLEVAKGLALRKFMTRAESHHAKHKPDLPVANVLSTETAPMFLQFCRDTLKSTSISYDGVEVRNSVWTFSASLDGQPFGDTLNFKNKKMAEEAACLSICVTLLKKQPELMNKFKRSLQNGKYIPKMAPVTLDLPDESVGSMRKLVYASQKFLDGQRDLSLEMDVGGERDNSRKSRPRLRLREDRIEQKSRDLSERHEAWLESSSLAELRQKRIDLPMSQHANEVLEIVRENSHCIIIGATGSGKTTQVPQILLDEAIKNGVGATCNVVCTQPRRIAATSVARRVAAERDEQLGETVGYHVRFDPKLPQPGGSVLFCTTGILLQQLQKNPDDVYDSVSHLVIDEVHERDLMIDFLLIVIKKTMVERVRAGKLVPKVVLMSATMDAEQFSAYFHNALPSQNETKCPTLRVPGRAFPVTEFHLGEILESVKAAGFEGQMMQHKDTMRFLKAELDFASEKRGSPTHNGRRDNQLDWKRRAVVVSEDEGGQDLTSTDDLLVPIGLIAATIRHILSSTTEGAILVFLPGMDEILKTNTELLNAKGGPGLLDLQDSERFRVYMLHSSIQDSQKSVFEPVAPGCRKIILSTNIAETSVTIPEVQYVVDTGKSREKMYDQTNRITKLQCTWVSKSNARQRAGRAGRVQDGNYYALYTPERRDSMRAVGLPELLRSDLQETCLDIKDQAFKMPIDAFLAEAIEPPAPVAVQSAVRNLISLGALTEQENLTPLGRVLASLPVHPTFGKMIVMGIVFRCLEPMILIGAASEQRSLFVQPLDRKAEAQQRKEDFAAGTGSDHIATLRAFEAVRQVRDANPYQAKQYAFSNFIHEGAFRTIDATSSEIERILSESGLITVDKSRCEDGVRRAGGPELNENSNNLTMIKALLVAGLMPNLGFQGRRSRMYRSASEATLMMHPGSVNSQGRSRAPINQPDEQLGTDDKTPRFVAFSSLAKSVDGNTIYMRESTCISPLAGALFGGSITETEGAVLELDGWVRWYLRNHKAPFVQFKKLLERMLATAFSDLSRRQPIANDPLRALFARSLGYVLEGKPLPHASQLNAEISQTRRGITRPEELRRGRWSGQSRSVVDELFNEGPDPRPNRTRFSPSGNRASPEVSVARRPQGYSRNDFSRDRSKDMFQPSQGNDSRQWRNAMPRDSEFSRSRDRSMGNGLASEDRRQRRDNRFDDDYQPQRRRMSDSQYEGRPPPRPAPRSNSFGRGSQPWSDSASSNRAEQAKRAAAYGMY